jgi:hypothetical protein
MTMQIDTNKPAKTPRKRTRKVKEAESSKPDNTPEPTPVEMAPVVEPAAPVCASSTPDLDAPVEKLPPPLMPSARSL